MARDRSRSPTAGGKDWEADGWPAYEEYWRREAALKDMGLDVKLLFDNDEGFISFTVQILCGFEFRDVPPPDRRLHITIGKEWLIDDALLLQRISEEWSGRELHLPVYDVGSGGTAYIGDCELTRCPLLLAAYSRGGFQDYGGFHVSF